jgi:O-antigen biosynthesis protein
VTVSVCVPVYKRHDAPNLATLGASLAAALDGLDGELVVVLNGIDAEAARVPQGAVVVPQEHNRGVPAGWNLAARAASGDVLCFCNDDVVLGAGALRALAETLAAHPEAGVVGPLGSRWDVERGEHVDFVRSDDLGPGEVRDCDVVSGFLFATPRSVFDAIGGFDEAYTPASFEEVDYCTAVRLRLDRRCYVAGGIAHEHEWGISAKAKPWRRVSYDGRSELLWSIHRRNRRHYLGKWAARSSAR